MLFTAALSVVGGLSWCLAEHARRQTETFPDALRRYGVIILGLAVVVMAPTAAVLAAILAGPHHLIGIYGGLGLSAAVLLVAHGGLVVWLRAAPSGPAGRGVLALAAGRLAGVAWPSR